MNVSETQGQSGIVSYQPNHPAHSDLSTSGEFQTSLTLGERRSLARRPTSQSIERLLIDPDPVVIAHLLNSPRLIETDALKITSHRPQSPKILTLIFEHPKWGMRLEIKRALALHPDTPLSYRCVHARELTVKQLKDMTYSSKTHRILIAEVHRLIRLYQEAPPHGW